MSLVRSFFTSPIFTVLLTFSLSACSYLKKWNVEGVRTNQHAYSVHFNKNLDPDYDSGNMPIGFHSPLTHEGMLFTSDSRGVIEAQALSDGRSLWKHTETVALGPKPTLYKDQILYGSISGRFFSRHYLTGELKYSVDLGASVETPAVVYQGRAYMHLRDHRIMALDAETGKILWSYKRSVPFSTTLHRASAPIFFENRLYVGMADGYVLALQPEDGVLLWERQLAQNSKFVDVDSQIVIFQNNLLVASYGGYFSVLNPQNGQSIKSFDFITGRTPLVLSEEVYVGTVDGEVVRIDSNFNVVSKTQVAKVGITNLVLWKNYIVVSTTGREVYFLDPTSMKLKDKLGLGGSMSGIYGEIDTNSEYLTFITSRNRLMVLR